MDLRQLLPGLDACPPGLDVADIATHSGEVVPGGLFLACGGSRDHGLRFLDDAIGHGASVVAWEPAAGVAEPRLPANVAGVRVPGLRGRLGAIANEFFAAPSRSLAVAGITGTNGKTTVAWLLVQALARLGRRAGYVGTLGTGLGTDVTSGALTTPGCIGLHRQLRRFADQGATDVALEVSSHALDQGRTDGVAFRVAAFTNLTRDHLDYHGDLARYGAAKARLFLEHGAAHAVINVGDEFGRGLAGRLPSATRLLSVAARPGVPAMLQAVALGADQRGQRIALRTDSRESSFVTGLVGAFNVENLAVAAGILLAEGHDLDAVAAALADGGAPPGRMQLIRANRGPRVVVDFAHTPDALRRVLETLRAGTAGRLWCVFGCGGDRDAGKRPAMGAVAAELAERVVITDDNPRTEDPEAIVAAILAGAGRRDGVEVVRDRAAAIRHAVRGAGADDVVLVAGKGHESVQVIGSSSLPFSDQEEARRALAEWP